MLAIVLADGHRPDRRALDDAWPGWADGAAWVVAADGGADLARRLDLRVDRWVGDGDSVAPATLDSLRASGVAIELAPVDKDRSDTELAVLDAVAAGSRRLVIVGALGGPRVDHELATIALLGLPVLAGLDAWILDPAARIRLVTGVVDGGGSRRQALHGRIGDLVTLLPIGGDAVGVTTAGLRFPLVDETLGVGSSRGLSNVRERPEASVAIRSGRLLVIESPATLRP